MLARHTSPSREPPTTTSCNVRPSRRKALARGDLAEGRAIYHELTPLLRALASEPNPAPVKAALAAQGWVENELRSPMTPASEALTRVLADRLAA